MDAERIRIQADLRGLLDGDVHCDLLTSQLYASDASIYELSPLGVVRPRHAEDVRRCVTYASENGIPLFPRGAGTGLAGQALGSGIVLDFSRYMRRLLDIDIERRTVQVQPGLVLADLNRALELHGLLFGPDPATRSVTTLGSVIAVDTSGSHWPKYGSVGDVLIGCEAVLANGELVRMEEQSWQEPTNASLPYRGLVAEIGQLLHANQELLKNPPWKEVARGCGYRLERTYIDANRINLAKLQAGAEGTLGIMTEATLQVHPVPPARAVVLLFFDRLEAAAKAAWEAQKDEVAACDIMDRRLLEIAREIDKRYERLLPRGAEAMLLIEHQGDEVSEVRAKIMALVNRLLKRSPTIISSPITTDAAERDFYWRICRRVVPRLYQLKGSSRPLPFVDDMAVPVPRLAEFIVEIQNILKTERVTGTIFGHASHGQVHLRPFLDLNTPEDIAKLERLSDKLYEKVMDIGGVIAGEHAMGFSRSWYARRQLGARYPVCRRIKELFDPKGILNPGKVITDAPQRVSDHLRPQIAISSLGPQAWNPEARTEEPEAAEEPADEGVSKPNLLPILTWGDEGGIGSMTQSCNGCGRCRTNAPSERMCPMFRIGRDEESSPRAKANAMRAILDGKLPATSPESDEMKTLADRCFQCHQCRIECPASVDIPKIVTELKAQYVATNGLRWSDMLLTRLDLLASLASRFPKLANWALENRPARWLLEKATGIAASRRLPRIASQPFLRWAVRRRFHRPKRGGGRKVMFFVDQYVNWHNPMLGRAFVSVFQHQKVEVYIPPNQTPSWMAKIAMGDVQRARKLIKPNIKILADAVRQGYEIVSIEPSATLCLQHEYPSLFDNEDTRLIAAHSWDAGRYLWNLHQNNALELDFRPQHISILYHQPCHLRAIDQDQPGLQLLKLIPGLQILTADAGCSGMAGTFGMKRENFRTSLRIGLGLISKMQQTTADVGSTECSACKLQMEQGASKPTIHPIAMLAYAYGLLPEVEQWMARRNEGLTVQ